MSMLTRPHTSARRIARLPAWLFAAAGLAAAVATGSAMKPSPHHVAPAAHDPRHTHDEGPVVQLALLLDTSNSMDGLIQQAKAALWAVVNEVRHASHRGTPARLQVALYEYGNDWVPAEQGHVRLRTPFTANLDMLSEQLFSLQTHGGEEYCGLAISVATRELNWIPRPGDPAPSPSGRPASLEESAAAAVQAAVRGHATTPIDAARPRGPVVRIIVIAGNEPFSQGSEPYAESIAAARAAGITVNTIYCRDGGDGSDAGWKDGARLGGGVYACIDSHRSVTEPPTPYDDRLGELNTQLNATYLAFGDQSLREHALARQSTQDALNASAGVAASRYEAKAGTLYDNREWDLVDAVRTESVAIAEIPEEQLPEALRGKSVAERAEAVAEMSRRREAVRQEILATTTQRAEWLAQHAAAAASEGPSLHESLLVALREQLAAEGLTRAAEPTAP